MYTWTDFFTHWIRAYILDNKCYTIYVGVHNVLSKYYLIIAKNSAINSAITKWIFFSKYLSNADFRNLTHLKSDYTKSAVYIVQFHKEKKKDFWKWNLDVIECCLCNDNFIIFELRYDDYLRQSKIVPFLKL